ncbi:hypothetical protein SO802_006972 [Lithocarpus litseifolius]|uniref:Fatty acyl-CoA reductase n=1 Tax=Lithocarpus litseifolius TaxID=425828 RepID=A0AAW2DP29_9ROSI
MSTASVPYKSYSRSLTSTHAIPYGTSIPVLTTTKSYHCYHHYNSTRTSATGRTFRAVCCENKENAGGDSIGIVSYLQGKNYLITGATGFLAKAYVSGERQGLIMEKPFHMGQTIAEESAASKTPPESIAVLDIIAEIELASDLKLSVHKNAVAQKMIELAKIFGWQNTYVFTKAMGEMLLNSMRGDIPVVIIRPGVIESSIKDPFPGWIQGIKMLDPLILSYGKGRLPGFLGDPKAVIDMVPLDMVVNASIAAIAKHGIAAKLELNVYHVGSSAVNPLLIHDLFKFSCNHFTCSPLMNSERTNIHINEMKFFNSMDKFTSYISDEIAQRSGLMDTTITDSKFDNQNTQKLMEGMSLEEMRNFGFNVGSINWEDYILNVHIPDVDRSGSCDQDGAYDRDGACDQMVLVTEMWIGVGLAYGSVLDRVLPDRRCGSSLDRRCA